MKFKMTALGLTLLFARVGSVEASVSAEARILMFEDQRYTGDGELEQLMLDPAPRVRARAASAAGRIGDLHLVPALVVALADDSLSVRRAAAFALGEVESPEAFEPLAGALESTDPELRLVVIEALGKLRDPRADEPLRGVLQSATATREDKGAVLLQIWRFRVAESLALAREHLQTGDLFLRRRAAYCLMRSGAQEAVTELAAALNDGDATVRSLAARALGNSRSPDAVVPLLELLKRTTDSDDQGSGRATATELLSAPAPAWQIRVNALRSLGRLRDARAEPAQIAALDDPSADVQSAAIEALSSCGGAAAVARLTGLLDSPHTRVRELSLDALAQLDQVATAAAVDRLADDPSWSVQAARVRALGRLGRVNELLAIAEGADHRVLADVISGMIDLEVPELGGRLGLLLGHPDPVVRSLVLDRLGEGEVTDATLELMLQAWKGAADDKIVDARISALQALSRRLEEFSVRKVFFSALKDRDWLVRSRAVELMQAAGMKGDLLTAGKVDTGRTPQFYEQVAEWARSVTPVAVLETSEGAARIALDVRSAPLTVYNFITLARADFYQGVGVHRVVPNFVTQAGCPRGDGWGGPGYSVRCEVNGNRFVRGAVGMALAGKDTGGSQFFVTKSDQPHLDGGYTVFGRVTQGLEAFDQLRQGAVIESVAIIGAGRLPGSTRAETESRPPTDTPIESPAASNEPAAVAELDEKQLEKQRREADKQRREELARDAKARLKADQKRQRELARAAKEAEKDAKRERDRRAKAEQEAEAARVAAESAGAESAAASAESEAAELERARLAASAQAERAERERREMERVEGDRRDAEARARKQVADLEKKQVEAAAAAERAANKAEEKRRKAEEKRRKAEEKRRKEEKKRRERARKKAERAAKNKDKARDNAAKRTSSDDY